MHWKEEEGSGRGLPRCAGLSPWVKRRSRRRSGLQNAGPQNAGPQNGFEESASYGQGAGNRGTLPNNSASLGTRYALDDTNTRTP